MRYKKTYPQKPSLPPPALVTQRCDATSRCSRAVPGIGLPHLTPSSCVTPGFRPTTAL
jgi:hypothetical protein